MSDTTILEGPDGRLYEIPGDKLAEFAVPGERVADIRRRMADESGAATAPERNRTLPPGHSTTPPGIPEPKAPSMTFRPAGGVVLNFYFQTPPPEHPPSHPAAAPHPSPTVPLAPGIRPETSVNRVHGYHMAFDESGIPVNHTDMLWGDYIDKQGNPAVGWHSHDPVTGNAQ